MTGIQAVAAIFIVLYIASIFLALSIGSEGEEVSIGYIIGVLATAMFALALHAFRTGVAS